MRPYQNTPLTASLPLHRSIRARSGNPLKSLQCVCKQFRCIQRRSSAHLACLKQGVVLVVLQTNLGCQLLHSAGNRGGPVIELHHSKICQMSTVYPSATPARDARTGQPKMRLMGCLAWEFMQGSSHHCDCNESMCNQADSSRASALPPPPPHPPPL